MLRLKFIYATVVVFLITNPVNSFSQGVISFDNQMIESTEIPKANEFNLSDNLYGRIFMAEPLSYYFDKNNFSYDFNQAKYSYNYVLRVYLEDELLGNWYYEMPETEFERRKSIELVLNTDDVYHKRKFSSLINDWADLISNNIKKPGEYKIRFEIQPTTIDIEKIKKPVIAKGSITMNVSTEELASFKERATPDLPLATAVDDLLEWEIIKASEGLYPFTEPIEAIITDANGGFTYVRDEHGFVLYRNIIASVVYKQRDGKCWVHTDQYTQEHRGYGRYGNLIQSKHMDGYHNYEIPCEKVETNNR